MLHHWKIRNLANRKAYFVVIHKGVSALDQVHDFMVEHDIKARECRILETSSRFINMPYREYVMRAFSSKATI